MNNYTVCHWDFTKQTDARSFANVLRFAQGCHTLIIKTSVSYNGETGIVYRVFATSPAK